MSESPSTAERLAALRRERPKHAAFVLGVAGGKDARNAWVGAGHADSPAAKKSAWKWRHHYADLIADLAAEAQARAAADAEAALGTLADQASDDWLTRQYVRNTLRQNAEAAFKAQKFDAVNTALVALGKDVGMFVERSEISGPGGGAVEVTVTRRVIPAPPVDA